MTRSTLSTLLLCVMTGLPGPAQNILNNGGFETGLMCYSYWTWSVTGQDFVGDYTFSLSTDSHSGSYSFQIACTPGGTDCDHAALLTQDIPAIPNQQYTMSVWLKCPTGTTSPGIFGPISPNVNLPMTTPACNTDWTFNTFTFQATSTLPYFWIAIYNYGTQPMLIDDLVLTYADGTAPARINLYPGVRQVSVSGQNVLVDGAPYLALGFFDVPRSDIPLVQATGANTIHGLGSSSSADCFNTGTESYLDAIYQANMNFVPDSTWSARMDLPAIFPPIMDTFAPHLANIAWFLADEPDLIQLPVYGYIDPTTFVAEANSARSATSLPLFADFQEATYASSSVDAPYAPAVDFWMAEPYGPNFSTLPYATNLLTSIAPRPIWLALDNIDAGLIVPKAYWAIVNGATGIFYFDWAAFSGDASELAAATQSFSELTTLKNAIFGTKEDNMVTPPPGITTMSRFNQNTLYILAVNPNSQTVQGTFSVSGLPAGQQINVMFENRTITAGAGGFTDSFAGIARHVYAITPNSARLSAAVSAHSGPATARSWAILAHNSGNMAANSASITNVQLTQTAGAACTPGFHTTFPLSLGTIAAGASTTANLTGNFTGCATSARFTVTIFLSANNGASKGTSTLTNQSF